MSPQPDRSPKAMTLRLPSDEVKALDQAILEHSARLGRRFDRTETFRGLAHLFVGDPQVADRALQAAVELVQERGLDGRSGGRTQADDTGIGL